MKPVRFDYARPVDLAEAIALGGRDDVTVKYLAGGQSLGPMLNLRLVQPDLLVDITAIAELKRVEQTAESLILGSCITHADIEDGRVPDITGGAMRSIAASIAYRAVRNRGTVGGSLVHADPSADWMSALAALGAQAIVRARRERRISLESLMIGVFECSLAPGELLTAVEVPRVSAAARWGYYKHCRKTGELAGAIGAYLYDPDRSLCRAVIGATGTRPLVFNDATALFGGAAPGSAIDRGFVERAMTAHGVTESIAQQIHFACLKRAIAQAHRL